MRNAVVLVLGKLVWKLPQDLTVARSEADDAFVGHREDEVLAVDMHGHGGLIHHEVVFSRPQKLAGCRVQAGDRVAVGAAGLYHQDTADHGRCSGKAGKGRFGTQLLHDVARPDLVPIGEPKRHEMTPGPQTVDHSVVDGRCRAWTILGLVVTLVGLGDAVSPQLVAGGGVEGREEVRGAVGEGGHHPLVDHGDAGVSGPQGDRPEALEAELTR